MTGNIASEGELQELLKIIPQFIYIFKQNKMFKFKFSIEFCFIPRFIVIHTGFYLIIFLLKYLFLFCLLILLLIVVIISF